MAVTSVFISSTSSDLKEHRAAVRESLLNAGYHPIDMADFMARSEGATSACLNEVAEADIFVGIYAWRYGFIPPDSKISITEDEFEEARRLGKPCFCFMVEEGYEWPAQFKEEGKGGELLKKFKARLDATLVRTTFSSPNSLAKNVLSSLIRWEKEQHKITLETTTQLLADVALNEDAINIIATMLDARAANYEIDENSGVFNVDLEGFPLVIETFNDSGLGRMIDFRVMLAANVNSDKISADALFEMLAVNWDLSLGSIAFDAENGTLWYSHRFRAAAVTEDILFDSMNDAANIADGIFGNIAELLPAPPQRRSKKK